MATKQTIPEFEVIPPEKNDAANWNANIKDGAKKAGVELPAPGAIRITEAPPEKEKPEPVQYKAVLNVNGKDMEFIGDDAAHVLSQYSAAVEAARLAAAPAPAAAAPEPKPTFTEAEMFDIQLGLQKGDPKVLDNYILKSGLVKQYLESEGISIDQLKAATTATQSNAVHNAWTEATNQFLAKVKTGEIDWPGGAQNMQMLGMIMAKNGLKPSLESMIAGYEEMKQTGMVFPAAAKTQEQIAAEAATAAAATKKKDPPGSTAIGTGGGKPSQAPTIEANRRFEIDMTKLSVREASESYNSLIAQGVKPEQISVKQ